MGYSVERKELPSVGGGLASAIFLLKFLSPPHFVRASMKEAFARFHQQKKITERRERVSLSNIFNRVPATIIFRQSIHDEERMEDSIERKKLASVGGGLATATFLLKVLPPPNFFRAFMKEAYARFHQQKKNSEHRGRVTTAIFSLKFLPPRYSVRAFMMKNNEGFHQEEKITEHRGRVDLGNIFIKGPAIFAIFRQSVHEGGLCMIQSTEKKY